MKTSDKGLALIKQFEGCELTAYRCPAGVWTIGYGHTGADVTPGKVITLAQAETLLRADLGKFEGAVTRLAKSPTQGQFDALVAFAYNVGIGALERSTLLRSHNAGDHAGAKAQFARWNKAAGRVLRGLTTRRAAEATLYGAP